MGKKIRLDKFLADAGIGSRKEVKRLIRKKRVKINDEIVKSTHAQVDLDKDKVYLDDVEIKTRQGELYYMFNKPKGYITARDDMNYPVIMEFFKENPYFDKLFPVGRLDMDTEGLLIITTDGQLAHRLAHPKWNVEKEYIAVVEGVFDLSKEEIDKLAKEGLLLKKDNYQTKPFKIEVLELDKENNRSKISITITEGKHHIVKRIMKELGFPVLYLKRVRIGNLKLDENLQEGEYRELTEEEIENLKKLVKLTEVKDG